MVIPNAVAVIVAVAYLATVLVLRRRRTAEPVTTS